MTTPLKDKLLKCLLPPPNLNATSAPPAKQRRTTGKTGKKKAVEYGYAQASDMLNQNMLWLMYTSVVAEGLRVFGLAQPPARLTEEAAWFLAQAQVVRRLPTDDGGQFAYEVTAAEQHAGACPDCGSQLEFAEGCKKCHVCGYSECG